MQNICKERKSKSIDRKSWLETACFNKVDLVRVSADWETWGGDSLYDSVQSVPGALYLFLLLYILGLVVWSFALSYFLNKGRKRIPGLFLAFFPAIIIVSAFLSEMMFSRKPWQDMSYVLSTLRYHLTYYVAPSVIGYVAGFFIRSLRKNDGGFNSP